MVMVKTWALALESEWLKVHVDVDVCWHHRRSIPVLNLAGVGKEGRKEGGKYWVAVKELKSSYYIGETLSFTIYTHYGNLI